MQTTAVALINDKLQLCRHSPPIYRSSKKNHICSGNFINRGICIILINTSFITLTGPTSLTRCYMKSVWLDDFNLILFWCPFYKCVNRSQRISLSGTSINNDNFHVYFLQLLISWNHYTFFLLFCHHVTPIRSTLRRTTSFSCQIIYIWNLW